MDLGLHNTNRHDTIDGPAITVPPLQAKLAEPRPSCRDAILDAIERFQQRTGATEFARRDIVAEVQDTAAGFGRQTTYRCLRRLTGQEPGSAVTASDPPQCAPGWFASDFAAEVAAGPKAGGLRGPSTGGSGGSARSTQGAVVEACPPRRGNRK